MEVCLPSFYMFGIEIDDHLTMTYNNGNYIMMILRPSCDSYVNLYEDKRKIIKIYYKTVSEHTWLMSIYEGDTMRPMYIWKWGYEVYPVGIIDCEYDVNTNYSLLNNGIIFFELKKKRIEGEWETYYYNLMNGEITSKFITQSVDKHGNVTITEKTIHPSGYETMAGSGIAVG